jgi:hypothetical protein
MELSVALFLLPSPRLAAGVTVVVTQELLLADGLTVEAILLQLRPATGLTSLPPPPLMVVTPGVMPLPLVVGKRTVFVAIPAIYGVRG